MIKYIKLIIYNLICNIKYYYALNVKIKIILNKTFGYLFLEYLIKS